MGNNRCEKCGEREVAMDEISGILVCHSCGFVVEDTGFTTPWDYCTADGAGNFVAEDDMGAIAGSRYASLANGRWVNRRGAVSYREKKKLVALNKIDTITARLRFPASKIGDVKHMVQKISGGGWGIGRWMDILIGACVYVVVRESFLPLTLVEVSSAVECDVSELGRMYNRVLKFLDLDPPKVDLFVFLDRAVVNIPEFSSVSNAIREKLLSQGRLLLECSFEWFLTTGRHHLPIVVAVLGFLAEFYGINVSLKEIADELNVPIHTCRLRHGELLKGLVRVGQKFPWGKDICTNNVCKHAQLILRYIEIKEKGQKKNKGRKTDCGSALAADSNVLKENAIFSYKTQSSESTLDVDLQRGEAENQFSCELGSVREEQSKLSIKSLASLYADFNEAVDFLRSNASILEQKMGSKKRKTDKGIISAEDQSSAPKGLNCSIRPHPRLSMDSVLKKQGDSDFQPPAFLANREARARRREKINRAKSRLVEVRKSLDRDQKDLAVEQDAVPNESTDGSCILAKNSKRKRTERYCNLTNWEDSIIECLLLHGVDEKQIEEGHYNTLWKTYVQKSEGSVSDKEIEQYIRPSWEVALWASYFSTEPSYPWLKKDELQEF